jgi:hypothetical protein
MEEVSEEELKEVLWSFQKNKSMGSDVWPLTFFIGLYELIGRDLLKVVEEASLDGHMHAPLNSTFITLIPKSNSLEYFEDFKPISLCNSIYKVVAKIIARRLKPILSTTISKEQFGFLEGR